MATRQITISDLSGKELDEFDHVRVVMEHPDHPVALELDVSSDEADRLQNSTLRLVNCTILAPNRPPRRVVIETKTLDKLFDGIDINDVLEGARSATARPAAAPAARASASEAPKVDYSSPDHAGILHRGRVTDREAAFVRANLDQANANRARMGQPAIDPDDPAERKRYSW